MSWAVSHPVADRVAGLGGHIVAVSQAQHRQYCGPVSLCARARCCEPYRALYRRAGRRVGRLQRRIVALLRRVAPVSRYNPAAKPRVISRPIRPFLAVIQFVSRLSLARPCSCHDTIDCIMTHPQPVNPSLLSRYNDCIVTHSTSQAACARCRPYRSPIGSVVAPGCPYHGVPLHARSAVSWPSPACPCAPTACPMS